jgi:hypothetical protein
MEIIFLRTNVISYIKEMLYILNILVFLAYGRPWTHNMSDGVKRPIQILW